VRHALRVLAILIIGLAMAPSAFAGTEASAPDLAACTVENSRPSPWAAVNFGVTPAPAVPSSLALSYTDDQATATRRVVAFEYSDGYKTRARIHRIGSYFMLPLFVAYYFVGQHLYDNPGEQGAYKNWHVVLAASTGVLFGMNTVTGVWNMVEARKDPSHRTKRTIHGILMLAADAGFLATGLMTPSNEGTYDQYVSQRQKHRTVALTSMGIATVGYVMMLLGR